MPPGNFSGHTAARSPESQPTPVNTAHERATEKNNLKSWWRGFRTSQVPKKEEEKVPEPQGIFGVPLQQSIRYANVAISLYDQDGNSYIYGYVPIVVAKCGVFLKEKATDVEGIFRLSGSEKRIKELRQAFDSPDRYGKGLDWTGYTVHDAANILRRYFNQLPEPIIPLEFYDRFREPLRGHQEAAVGHFDHQEPNKGHFDEEAAIRMYQRLIQELPPLNRQLLLYILDLLAVFSNKHEINKMPTSNLAAIFQPGILSHPAHDMAPGEYRLSQDVLIFLIDKQDNFLIGMKGTAADEKTVREIESGPPTPSAKTPTTPGRKQTFLSRSASTASAGAESIKKFGSLRRNVSVSSRGSKHSTAAASPISPGFARDQGSGVHRSNTVPSKKSPGLENRRFFRNDRASGPQTPDSMARTPDSMSETPPLVTAHRSPFPAMAPANEPTPVSEPATTPFHETAKEAAPLPTVVSPVAEVPLEEVLAPTSSEETTPLANPEGVTATTGLINTSVGPAQAVVWPTAPVQQTTQQSMQQSMPPPQQVMQQTIQQPIQQPSMAPPPMLAPGSPESVYNTPMATPIPRRIEEGDYMTQATGASGSPEPVMTNTFLSSILGGLKSPPADGQQGRKPNKLQKKRAPASNTSRSAHSSSQSLSAPSYADQPPSPRSPDLPSEVVEKRSAEPLHLTSTPIKSTENRNKPAISPSASYTSHSSVAEFSDPEPRHTHPIPAPITIPQTPSHGAESQPMTSPISSEQRKSRWKRFSRSTDSRKGEGSVGKSPNPSAVMLDPPPRMGMNPDGGRSASSVNSLGVSSAVGQTTKSSHAPSMPSTEPTSATGSSSTQNPNSASTAGLSQFGGSQGGSQFGNSPPGGDAFTAMGVSDGEEREKSKGPLAWFRGKVKERQEKEAERRAKSPDERSFQGGASMTSSQEFGRRGKSMDLRRGRDEERRE